MVEDDQKLPTVNNKEDDKTHHMLLRLKQINHHKAHHKELQLLLKNPLPKIHQNLLLTDLVVMQAWLRISLHQYKIEEEM